jgi:Domain of unknown function (DUF6438)
MRLTLPCLAAFVTLSPLLTAQTSSVPSDFSITLERTDCLGSCPGYDVTILADGSVHYNGKFYVHVKGARSKIIPVSNVEKLVQTLLDENFFAWEEKKGACLDFPDVSITVTLNGQHKHVYEGCNRPGQVLKLADTVDKVAGIKGWAGHSEMP